MKAFSKLLFILIVGAVVYYLFFVDSGDQKQAVTPPLPPPQKVTKAVPPPAKKPAIYPGSATDQMTPPWPPATGSDETVTLAKTLTKKNFVMILDGSGSMSKQECSGNLTKSEVAKQAVIEWSTSVPDDANLGLIVFDKNSFSIRLPLGQNNREQFRAEVQKVIPDYKTPLTKSLNTAYNMLTKQGRRQLGYGEYTVVIVTDGVANNIKALEQSVNMVLATSPIMIHTIGFCIASDHSLNREGRTIYRAADNPADLRKGLQEVLAESESFDVTGFK